METPLLVSAVGAIGALVGSSVGGLISYFSTRSVRRQEWKQSFLEKNLRLREDLYAEFLAESSRLMLASISTTEKKIDPVEFSKLVALETKIWFHSEALGKIARQIAKTILGEFSPKQESEEEKKQHEATFADLRDQFVMKCREEIRAELENA